MNLKGKLSTLRTPLPRAEVPPSTPATLELLRRRMAEILAPHGGCQVAEPAALPRWTARPYEPEGIDGADFSDLPFVVESTNHGTLWRRQQVLAPSSHVGRIPLEAARDASGQMLALLALCPELADCALDGALFLDTETTGLGGTGAVAFLVGLAWFEASGQLVLEQLLLRQLSDEAALLQHLRERFDRASMLVTYNGKTFDMPLLSTRFVMNRLPAPRVPPHLDLLHVARRLHKSRLGQCRLVSLESGVLGFERGPDVPGEEIPPLFTHYLRTGQASVLWPVVEHNAWDVMSMAALTGLYGEPVEVLHADDLVGLAQTLKRAGALAQADEVADRAVQRGAGPRARYVRGKIAKARGDKNRALADFESLSDELDDPALRLELAKLYEHHVKAPLKALTMLERGTGETALSAQKRHERLLRKHLKSIGFQGST
ncbi:MAG TPA: ribonuclease H-like domain-containing protein [Polyangiaceae bacterium]|nr:ribonuclease H-like domain-containing protein [Polyangiaceae bacterium]